MLRTHQTFKEGRKRVTIQYMPAGESVIDATVNGDPARRTVRVDGKTAARLQEDLEAAHARSAAGQAAAPCGYFDHRSGPASFRPVRFIDGGSRGVLLEVELTEAGRKALEGGDYGYFSPTFRRDKATGEVLGLRADTVEVGSLVNDPAFQTIEQIAAARANAEEDAEGEENVSTARPLAFTKEEKKKPAAPAPVEDEGDDIPDEAEEKEGDGSFLDRWKKHVSAYNPAKKKKPDAEKTEAGRTFLQAWGQRQAEQVAAANPYGCNQYGHEWKGKHGEGWKPSGRGADNTNAQSQKLKAEAKTKLDEKLRGVFGGKVPDFVKKALKLGSNSQKSVDSVGDKRTEKQVANADADALDAEQRRRSEPVRKAEEKYEAALKKAGEAYNKHGGDSKEYEKAISVVEDAADEARKERLRYNEWFNTDGKARWDKIIGRGKKDEKPATATSKELKSTVEAKSNALNEARRKRDELNAAYWEKRKAYQERTGSGIGRPDFDQTKEGRAALEERVKQYDVVKQLERKQNESGDIDEQSTFAANKAQKDAVYNKNRQLLNDITKLGHLIHLGKKDKNALGDMSEAKKKLKKLNEERDKLWKENPWLNKRYAD